MGFWQLSLKLNMKINRRLDLFTQGGPHNHTIGGLAVCLKYAQSPEFKAYQTQVLHLLDLIQPFLDIL